MTAQSDTVQRGREERFRWDEENRLTALSQNGYVSHYWYDADGNLTRDRNKGIRRITYNVLNLPQEVTFTDGHIIRYRYAADGRKLRTDYVLSNYTVIDNPGGPSILHSGGAQPMGGGTFTPGDGLPDPENQLETTLMVRDYCGSHVYRDRVLERIMGDYGYMDGTGNYHYFIKDYQGNVRAVIDQQGTLEEVNNYYPYGGLLGGGTVGGNQGVQPYKYGAKELDRQNGLDWYDSQARMYDPVLGRTPTIDPKAEEYTPISPYAWCAGNPIRFIDQNGRNYYYFDSNGDFERVEVNNSPNRLVIHSMEQLKSGTTIDHYEFYSFADPINDAKEIDNGSITKIIFVTDEDIQEMLEEQGAYTANKFDFYLESHSTGKFDYSYSKLPHEYPDANFNGLSGKSSYLFLPKGEFTAHNFMNFGNYLWAATGEIVGFSLLELKIGAHLNARFNRGKNGYESQWDALDDQLSIQKGYIHMHNKRRK